MKNLKKVLFVLIVLFVSFQCVMATDLTDSYQDLYLEITADNFC